MKPWQAILMYLGGVLIFVSLSYGYYIRFEKVYTYEVIFSYIKPPPGLPELPDLVSHWSPILTYDVKGMNGCDYLTQMQKNEYDLTVISCEKFAKREKL